MYKRKQGQIMSSSHTKHYFSTCEKMQYVREDMEKTHYKLFDFGSLSKTDKRTCITHQPLHYKIKVRQQTSNKERHDIKFLRHNAQSCNMYLAAWLLRRSVYSTPSASRGTVDFPNSVHIHFTATMLGWCNHHSCNFSQVCLGSFQCENILFSGTFGF